MWIVYNLNGKIALFGSYENIAANAQILGPPDYQGGRDVLSEYLFGNRAGVNVKYDRNTTGGTGYDPGHPVDYLTNRIDSGIVKDQDEDDGFIITNPIRVRREKLIVA